MKAALITFVLLAAAVASAASVAFQAKVEIRNDPDTPNAYVQGLMNYLDTDASKIRYIKYTKPVMDEFIDYVDQARYKHCTKCEAYIYAEAFDILYKIGTDKKGAADGTLCTWYTRDNSNISRISVLNTNTNLPCQVEFVNGMTMIFSEQTTLATNNAAFKLPTTWNCPEPVCRSVVDIMLNIDNSGSINKTEWTQQVDFIKKFIDKLSMNPEEVNVGLNVFAGAKTSASYLLHDLSSDKVSVKSKISNFARTNTSGTCIGCGLYVARTTLARSKRASLNPSRIIVTITDGANNRPTDTYSTNLTKEAAKVHSADPPILSFAVGVKGAKKDEMNEIASNPNIGVATVFTVSDYSGLQTVLDKIVKVTCTHNKVIGGDCNGLCHGFCGCEEKCECPNVIPDTANQCYTLKCSVQNGISSSGWVYVANPKCDDSNACTVDTCVNATGCVYTDIPKPDDLLVPHECVSYKCEKNGGWSSVPVIDATKCTSDNACETKLCTAEGGCVATPVTCEHQACHIEACDPVLGCTRKLKCEASDKCHIAKCDPITEECSEEPTDCHSTPCFTRECDPLTGTCKTKQRKCDPVVCSTTVCVDTTPEGEDPCVSTPVTECGLCDEQPCDAQVCQNVECSVAFGATEKTCTYTPKTYEKKPCKITECDPLTDEAAESPEPPPADKLAEAADHPCSELLCGEDGEWYWHYLCAERTNSCEYPTCIVNEDNPAGICSTHSITKICLDKKDQPAPVAEGHAPCSKFTGECTANANPMVDGVCKTEPISCKESKCSVYAGCSTETNPDGECSFTERDCTPPHGERDYCALYKCNNGYTDGCLPPEQVEIPERNNCLVYTCDQEASRIAGEPVWTTEPLCHTESKCVTVRCVSETASCLFIPVECPLRDKRLEACFLGACNPESGCYYTVSETASFDSCGVCIQYSEIAQDENTDYDAIEGECTAAIGWPKTVAAITGGALAGIILAGIIGLIILGASGYMGTKEILRRSKLAKNQGAVNNPLYESSASEGVNPLFAGEEAAAL